MHILVIAPTPYFSDRGCHIRILEETKALQQHGHQAIIYTYHLGRTPAGIPVQRCARLPWYTKTSAGPAFSKPLLDLLLLWKMLRTARAQKFDLIHAHLHEGAALGVMMRWWLKRPLLIDLQSELVSELRSYGWLKHGGAVIVRWFERWLLRRADHVVVSNEGAATAARALWPKVENKLTILHDGVSAITPRSVQPNQTTIVYAGGTSAAKGFDLFTEALTELKRRQLDFNLYCIGKVDVFVKQHLAHAGLHINATWEEHIPYEQLGAALVVGTIGVDPKPPTSTEGSGKLLNYMAAGLAVVAFTSPTTQNLVGQAGVLVKTPTATALADALTQLIARPQEQLDLARAAQDRIQQRFLWSDLIQPVLSVYEKLGKR